MNIKRIVIFFTLLALLLMPACSGNQPAITISLDVIEESQKETAAEEVLAPSPVLGSETVITRQNAHTLTEVQHLGKGNINGIAWSPTGSPLALATTTGIYLVDPQTYQEVQFTKTATNSIAFSTDGTYLASPQGPRIILHDLRSESEPRVIEGHSDIYSIAFSPTENLLATSSQDGTIKVWDLSSGEELASLDKTGSRLHDLAFSHDGQILVSAAYSQESDHSEITLWDLDSTAEILPETKIDGTTLAVSPTSETIASGGYDVPLRLLDFNGLVRLTLDEEPKPVFDLAFSPDGKILASATTDRQGEMGLNTTLNLWDTTSGEILGTLEKDDGYYRISFSPDGTQLAAATLDKAKLWDIESGLEIATITGRSDTPDGVGYGTGSIDDFAWSPDGNALALATNKGINLVNMQTYEETHFNIDEDGFFPNGHVITFSPDGNLLAVSYISFTTRGFVKIYDVRSQELLFTLDDFNEDTFGIAFSPDNSILATGWGNTWGFAPGGVKLWDVSTGVLIAEYKHEGLATIYNLTFNREGNLLATINGEGYVYIWDIESGQEFQNFQGTGGFGYAVAFSPDGKVLAVGGAATSDDGTVCLRLIDLETEEILFDLQGHENWYVASVAFNADGGVLASASWDGTVRLWDTQTGQQLAELDVPGATSVGFSPDGTLLATAGLRDVLRLWRTPETAAQKIETSPQSALEDSQVQSSTLQAIAVGEDFQPGRWSLDGRFVYYSDQGPMDEPGPDQAYNTLTFLDTHTGETCASVQEVLTFSYNPWSETKIPEGPYIDERTFWMNDNRLLYLSPDGELIALTPCSDSVEDWTQFLPESVTEFHYSANFDHSLLLLKGESDTWLFTPSTGQSVKIAIPDPYPDEETRFAWSPWEAKLAVSRVDHLEGKLGVVIENIDPMTGIAETIAEFPVRNEGYGWGHSISPTVSWAAKDHLILHYLDNNHEQEKLIDFSSQPVIITDVFADLFGIESPSMDSGLSFFGGTGKTGEDDYYLTLGTGLSPNGQLYTYSAKTGAVQAYALDSPKLLVFPDGDIVIGESYGAKSSDVPLQIIHVETDKAAYDLDIRGQLPGNNSWGKIVMIPGSQRILIASDQGITLVDLENGEKLQFWVLENQAQYQDFYLSLSPDGKNVLVYAKQIDEDDKWWSGHTRAIYLLHLDD